MFGRLQRLLAGLCCIAVHAASQQAPSIVAPSSYIAQPDPFELAFKLTDAAVPGTLYIELSCAESSGCCIDGAQDAKLYLDQTFTSAGTHSLNISVDSLWTTPGVSRVTPAGSYFFLAKNCPHSLLLAYTSASSGQPRSAAVDSVVFGPRISPVHSH